LEFLTALKWKLREIFWIMGTGLMLKGRELQKSQKISKKWFNIRDTYGVEIDPGKNNALILTIAVVLDQMANED